MDDRLSVSALCFPGMPPMDVLDTVAGIGAAHTTLHVAAVADAGPAAVRSRGQEIGVSVEALIAGLGPILDEHGTWGGSRDQLNESVDVAAAAGAKLIYMLTGSRKGFSWDE